MDDMDQSDIGGSKNKTTSLSDRGSFKIYYLAVFAGVAINTIIYIVMGWIAVIVSVAYQNNDSINYYPEWLQLAGDSVFIIAIIMGGFVAASIADSSEILNAICVGIFDILFTALQLALFEKLYSDLSFLLIKSLSVIILAALGGYLVVVRKKRATQSLSEYFEKK